MKANRHRAREFTLQILYQMDIRGAGVDEILKTFWRGAGAHPVEKRVAEGHARGVARNIEAIDQEIEARSRKWRMSRMPSVDRNVLRMGVFELRYEKDTPAPVVIDECVELAKAYSTAESGAFVNGILDKVAHGRGQGDAAEEDSGDP